MSLSETFNSVKENLEDLWDENSNVILTAGAILGLTATIALTAHDSIKAYKKVNELNNRMEENDEELTTIDILKEVVPECLPSIAAAAFTMACIISNYKINEDQKIALYGAYAMLGKTYEKYRSKVKEVVGEEKAKEIDFAMADKTPKEIFNRTEGGFAIFTDDLLSDTYNEADECVFFDPYSGLYFNKTPEEIRLAMYHLNRKLNITGDAGMMDFYEYLGIEKDVANNVEDYKTLKQLGWNCNFLNEEYDQPWVDFDIACEPVDYPGDSPNGFYIIQPLIAPRPYHGVIRKF